MAIVTTSTPNQFDFQEIWEKQYEVSHYIAPVYKAIADEHIKGQLSMGQVFHRTLTGDFTVNNLGSDGSYSPQEWYEGDETVTVNIAKEVSVRLEKENIYKTHLPLLAKKSEKSMNALFRKIDGLVFKTAQQNAGQTLDLSALTGQANNVGQGITVTNANIPNIFTIAETMLIASNMDYEPTGNWTGQFKIDKSRYVPVAVISSQVYSSLLLYLGGKTTELGDRVSIEGKIMSGNVGKFMGFNVFVSNALPWTGQLQLPVAVTNGDTVTFLYGVSKNIEGTVSSQAITFKFVTSATNPGEITLSGTASVNASRLVAAINSPYVSTISTNFIPLAVPSSVFGQVFLSNIVASVDGTTNTSVDIIVDGMGNIPVSQTMTSVSNTWLATSLQTHCIMGVSRTVALVMPRMAEIYENPVSGKVARDYVAWCYFGLEVFSDQAPGIIDVQVATVGYTTMPNITSN